MISRGSVSLRPFLTLLLALLLWSGNAYAAGFPPAMIRDASRAVKMLVTEGNGARMGQGTGFFVTPDGLMLTNYHVVEGNRTVKIWDEKNLYDIVRIVAFDKNADVALLETNYPKSSVRHLPLRKDVVELGEPIMVLGYPRAFQLGDSITVTKGDISSIRKVGDDTLVQFTAFVAGGSSGSPIIDEKGRVAGIVTSELTLGQGMFLGLSAPSIQRYIAAHMPKAEELIVDLPPPPPVVRTPASPAAVRELPSDTSAMVKEAQELLNALGYDAGTEDGVYGPRTSAAVKAFQRVKKLRRDGHVTKKLLDLLREEKRASDEARAAAIGREIQALTENAMRGNPDAQRELGLLYREGRRVPPDYSKAAGWLRMAALNGDVVAQTALASMYRYGLGVPLDRVKAVSWMTAAAELGHAPAQLALGEMFAGAFGVPLDRKRAFAWYRNAAEQGYAPAQLALADAFEHGIGTPPDRRQAILWFMMAAEQGDENARNALRRLRGR